jgi:PKD repeat protein
MIPVCSSAQKWIDPQEAQTPAALEEIFRQNFETGYHAAVEKLRLVNQPARIEHPNGEVWEVMGVSTNGLPWFNKTFNLPSANTIGTSKVWPGGTLGLTLTGQGMGARLAVWDGGGVYANHREFTVNRVLQKDNPGNTIQHATHVAGTMVATGVDPTAKGMAYQASLHAYDWTGDLAEMTSEAASGLLVSNHSYGTIAGWNYNGSLNRWEWYGDYNISTTEDYNFGFYDQVAASWDNVAWSNPNYLIVKASGNDRGENRSSTTWYRRDAGLNWVQGSGTAPAADGPYDCISTYGTAKNILTVGSVKPLNSGYAGASSVVVSSFSSWGPADDGRIKPDVVACGEGVYSTDNAGTASYATLDGTSMATPSVAGSALLIQQHYRNLTGKYMRSASLKGLIIHTADEAGNAAGPDYKFGWGLMNTARAAQHLTDSAVNLLQELTLANQTSYSLTFYSDGSSPIRATICWNDVPGAPVAAALDPADKMLVNDLDLRIQRKSDHAVFSPYVLNRSNPAAIASTGDNSIDNVEQVYIDAPPAGTYTITVSHKSSLYNNAAQQFTLILSGRSLPPIARFGSDSRTICTGKALAFHDLSKAGNRNWYFPGGSPATSTAQDPLVTYAIPGIYPVGLSVSNLAGADSVFMTDYVNAGGFRLPLTETFENNSATRPLWSVQNPNNDTTFRLWQVAGTTPGNLAFGINNYDYPGMYKTDALESPVLDLRGLQNATLTFMHAYSRYLTNSDTLSVSISNNCGATWTRLSAVAEDGSGTLATGPDTTRSSDVAFVPANASDWCGGGKGAPCFSFNLAPYLGSPNMSIRIQQIANSGNNLFIDNVNVTGTPLSPVANFYLPSTTVCQGLQVLFMDSSLNNPSSWEWHFTGAAITSSTAQNPVVIYNSAGTFPVSLKVTNQSGSDSIMKTGYVTVLASPAVPVLTSNHAPALCNGDSMLLTSSVANNLYWYRDGIVISGQTNASLTVKDAGKYTVRSYGTSGCYSQSAPQNITAGNYPPKPVITKSLSGNIFCSAGSFTLTSSAPANNQWLWNGTAVAGQNSSSFTFADSGTFQVKVSNNGCEIASDPLRIDKLQSPATSDIHGAGYAAKGSTVTYSVTGTAGSTFNWTASGGTVNGAASGSSITITWGTGSSGSLQVQETGSNGCKGSPKTLSVSLVNTGISDYAFTRHVHLYPNPTNGLLRVEVGQETTGVHPRIFNMLGQQMRCGALTRDRENLLLDVTALEAGVYMLELQFDDGGAVRSSFVKE